MKLLSILTYKVRRYSEHLLEALYVPAEVWVIRRLLEVADLYNQLGEEWVVPLSQEDLAGLAGTLRLRSTGCCAKSRIGHGKPRACSNQNSRSHRTGASSRWG